jgi:mRNA interferase MazF
VSERGEHAAALRRLVGRPRYGREGSPALVISVPANDADRSLVALAPHTTSVRGSRFEAATPVSFLKPGAFDAQNLITIPHAKLVRALGKLSAQQLTAVETVVRAWLGLTKSGA